MDLANYRVLGAAPRLPGPRQNGIGTMDRNRGFENIQIALKYDSFATMRTLLWSMLRM